MLRTQIPLPQKLVSAPAREAATMLRQALTRTRLAHEHRVAVAQFPEAKAILERLAWYITDQMPVPVNGSIFLLDLCLKYAHKQLRTVQAASLNPVSLEVRKAWIAGLFWHTAQMSEIQVIAGGQEWDPFEGRPLGEWLRGKPAPTFAPMPPSDAYAAVNPRAMRMAVAAAVMPNEELARIGLTLETLARYEVN